MLYFMFHLRTIYIQCCNSSFIFHVLAASYDTCCDMILDINSRKGS